MAISDYGTLKSAVASYLNRSDLTSQIPDFISLGALRIHYGSSDPLPSQPLRVPAMQTRATFSGSLPADFLEMIRLTASDGNLTWKLDYAESGEFTDRSNSSDLPTVYTFLNGTIETAGTQSATLSLDYYAAFDAFAADVDTNWLLTNYPFIYLYAALLESAPFIQDMTMLQPWHGLYKSAVSALNLATKKPGGGSLVVRVR